MATPLAIGDRVALDAGGLDALIGALAARGYQVAGPVVADGAVRLGPLGSSKDLPKGWRDEQSPGRYRLAPDKEAGHFGHGPGPDSWKKLLYPVVHTLCRIRKSNGTFTVLPDPPAEPPWAFVGVRACEREAIARLDRVLGSAPHPAADYAARRAGLVVVAVNCTSCAATCFCASLGTGPVVREGFDVALTELSGGVDGEPVLLAEVGSATGGELLAAVPHHPATSTDVRRADEATSAAAEAQTRTVDTAGLRERMYAAAEDPHWEDTASRCLACGNCTLVCPTCFCTTVDDVNALGDDVSQRRRRWDTCFSLEFSYIHGGSVRTSGAARYRQWATHKLAAWQDQFGETGCVGCGRCITWCPAGIDITAEVAALGRGRAEEGPHDGHRDA